MNRRTAGILPAFALAAHLVCAETHPIPLFLAAGDSSLRSVVRVINLSDEAGPVTVTAFTDGGVEWEGTSFRIEGNAVFAFNADDLEYGDPGKGLTGIGTGDGDWHLTLDSELPLTVSTYARSADGLLTEMNRTVPRDPDGIHRVMTFNPRTAMRRVSQLRLVNPHDRPVTVTVKGIDDLGADSDGSVTVTLAANGHLTNISYLPETERVVANTLSASFTYEEDEGTPFGIRFNADSSTGSIVSYDWDFGEVSGWVENTPGTGVTPFFVYDDNSSYVRTRGGVYDFEGRYPHTDTYTATLTIIDRAGSTAKRTQKVRVTNTLRFPGLRDLIGRIDDGGGHRGKLVISEMEVGEVFAGSHAEQTVYVSMKEEGVPTENVLVHGPEVTDRRMLGPDGILTHPGNASLRAETLVVNRSTLPAFLPYFTDAIAEHNIVLVAPTGNVDRYYENECDPEDMPDRDMWNRNHSFHSCEGRDDSIYRGAMQAIATGKALFATSADLQQDGSVEPYSGVIKCGDTRRSCFAVPSVGGDVTSSATAKLSAAVFHLFQLYEDADDVVRALKRCTRVISARPGLTGSSATDL